ncbi:MAG TPA: hypothetical protein VG406_10145 [Isosphaeraceae bacterium]|jgi:hypothetical protein|nr:hypothetical protein [Isosphaeraceae bacterium]
MQRNDRRIRRSRPGCEPLEGRQLLAVQFLGPQGHAISRFDANSFLLRSEGTGAVPLNDRFVKYQAPDGATVALFLHGAGSLGGTSLDPNGALHLIYSGTTSASTIVATVSGGSGAPLPLAEIRDANAAPGEFTGRGSEPLSSVKLRNFDLVDGGSIDLTGGIGILVLDGVGRNTQVHLTATQAPTPTPLRPIVQTSLSTPASGIAGAAITPVTSTPAGISAFGFGTGTGTGGGGGGAPGGAGGAAGGNATNAVTTGLSTPPSIGGSLIPTIGTFNSLGGAFVPSFTITPSVGGSIPGLSTGTTATAATTITPAVGGANSSQVAASTTSSATTTTVTLPSLPPGADIVIKHVRGAPRSTPLAPPEVFAYDATIDALVRFDATTGALLQSIPLGTTPGTPVAGVSMARDNGHLVALVGVGQTIRAFDAITGAPVGQFSTADLAAMGLKAIDGLGSTNTRTILTDSTAGSGGMAVLIDVTKSLATGQAVTVGSVFSPQRQFSLSGGATSIAGVDQVALSGAGFFDAYQPNSTQPGILVLNTTGNNLTEAARFALPTSPTTTAVGTPTNPTTAMGAIDSDIAVVTDVANGVNTVTLYHVVTSTLTAKPTTSTTANVSTSSAAATNATSRSTTGNSLNTVAGTSSGTVTVQSTQLEADGTVNLQDPHPLTGLSESFHPELAGAAIVDVVSGTVNSFKTIDATGLAFNSTGQLTHLQAVSLNDSAVVARPIKYVNVASRNNVLLLSTTRGLGTAQGVTVNPNLRQVGPLMLP